MKQIYTFVFALISTFLSAQTTGNLYYLSSTTGAACYEIEYFNNKIYAGAGNTLMVYTIAGNGTPDSITFEYRFGSNIADIKFRGNYMYVAANHAGLSVWNVSGAVPVFVDEFQPANLDEGAYDIAFKGSDSIYVAYKSKLALFTFNAGNLNFVNTFVPQVAGTYVMGCEVKNNILAYVTGAFENTAAGNSRTGVHISDANNPATQYSFYQQNLGDPHDVIFGQNTDLLHVMGGTESWVNGSPWGYYYALNISNPALPSLVFRDSLPNNFFFSIAQPMNGEIRNDTVFIATEGGWDQANSLPLYGHVYVYDGTNNNVSFVNEVVGGLWHFDVALNGDRMYVASEWYGIKTVDISNVLNETDMGNTLTGGWNLSSDVYGNRMVVGNEGYGFKYYDFTNPIQPTYLRSKLDTGFCMGVSFSQDGSHIFGWYYTDDDFRIHDTSVNFNVTASLPLTTLADYHDPCVYSNYALVHQQMTTVNNLVVVDAANYSNPVVDTTISLGGLFRDYCVDENGFVFIATAGTLRVVDINNNYAEVATTNAPAFQQFLCVTTYNDTVYAYMTLTGHGIRKYYFNGSSLTYLSGNTALTMQDPKFIAVDSFGLYADFQEEGLYAHNKNTMAQEGYYRHGMEYYRPANWGQQQLFCKDGYIFVVEYLGQTSVLTMNATLTGNFTPVNSSVSTEVAAFPNPIASGDVLTIVDPQPGSGKVLEVYDAQGKLVKSQATNTATYIQLETDGLNSGIYFFTISGNATFYQGKFIVGQIVH